MGAPIKELKLPEKFPEWFALMPEDAMLGYRELSSLLLCDRNTIRARRKDGRFPEHDKFSCLYRDSRLGTSLWKKSTIINFFEGKQNGR